MLPRIRDVGSQPERIPTIQEDDCTVEPHNADHVRLGTRLEPVA